MDPAEREALEETMLQSVIEAFFVEADDDIIKTYPTDAPIRPRLVSDDDE